MKNALSKQQWILVIAGISLECIYLFYFLRVFPLLPNYKTLTALGGLTGHSVAGFWSFLFSFTMLFVIFSFAWYTIQHHQEKKTLWIIGGFGLLFGITMSFTYPITATDIFNYIAQSRIWAHYHLNPIFAYPKLFPLDPIMTMTGSWGKYGSPYGPLGIMIHAIPSYLFQGNLLANLLFLKLLFSLLTVGTALVAYNIVRQIKPEYALSSALFIAWNPLILFEVSANGHNDIVMMFFVLWAILLFLRKYYKLGTIVLVISALVKFVSIILLPLFIVYALAHLPNWRKKIGYLLFSFIGSLAIFVSFYAPFWQGPLTLSRSLIENKMYLQSFSSFWGHSLTESSFREGLAVGRFIFFGIYGYFLWKIWKRKESLITACFLVTFFFLMFAISNFKIWYAVWPTILAALLVKSPERFMVTIFGYFATLAAPLFTFVYIWITINPQNFALVNRIAYFMTFIPAVVFYVGSPLYRKWKKS